MIDVPEDIRRSAVSLAETPGASERLLTSVLVDQRCRYFVSAYRNAAQQRAVIKQFHVHVIADGGSLASIDQRALRRHHPPYLRPRVPHAEAAGRELIIRAVDRQRSPVIRIVVARLLSRLQPAHHQPEVPDDPTGR